MSDNPDLERFVVAQEAAHTYHEALAELKAERKTGHWMWFIFPQLIGLGRSPMAQQYSIGSLAEANAYLDHPVLGPRLLDCVRTVGECRVPRAADVFGPVDATKLRSSLTLFMRARPSEPIFAQVLDRFFEGSPDPETDMRI